MPLWEPNMSMVNILKHRFAEDVFDETNQRKFLSPAAFKKFSEKLKHGEHDMIDTELANQVADGMKNWAASRGATHWTHWFQPLTGRTAEKHDTFIGHKGPDGHYLMELTGAELVRMEPDASSFPSGGLRNTAEARGYTVWDPVSPCFLIHYEKGATLFVPCAFVSWSRVSLDNKTPLLKSEEALSNACVDLLAHIGDKSTRVFSTLGCEQEFFVVDRKMFQKRPDLLLTGRTIQGALPAKGQELEDHYFGTIPRPIAACLQDMEAQLWLLGIPVTTRHNEVAPAQHEFAPVFEATDVAVDHQTIMMTVMQEKAREHGFEVLLHEKPFDAVNGSGKHNNWSLCTDMGTNLLNPPKALMEDPMLAFEGLDNLRFTAILASVIKAVDDHAGALRCSIACAGQDFRLGACEAPPAIISVYLGSALQGIVDATLVLKSETEEKKTKPKLVKKPSNHMVTSSRLPQHTRDSTDRNRTSPFAFTGNKFEFRAVGSSQNVAVPVTALNCAVACALKDMTDALEQKSRDGVDAESAIKQVVIETLEKHSRVIFNGNGYEQEWVDEATKRGLPNLTSTAKALINVDQRPIYTRTGTMTDDEVNARKHIALERYINTKRIEVKCMIKMTGSNFVPSAEKALARMNEARKVAKDIGRATDVFDKTIGRLCELHDTVIKEQFTLMEHLKHKGTLEEEAAHIDEVVTASMNALRQAADEIEEVCTADEWNLPTYTEMLFQQCSDR